MVGVGVALLLVVMLWLKHERPWRGTKYSDSAEPAIRQPDVLSAAAVSVLEDREVSDRTLLAAIIEMCQRGTLQFDSVKTRTGYRYRLTQQEPPQSDWEQLICDSLPSSPTTVQELHDLLNGHKDAIGDRLGEYLQRHGLFHDNPMRVKQEHFSDGFASALLAGALMGVAGGLWLALWLTQWWANSLVGAAIGVICWFIVAPMNTRMLAPTEMGSYVINQWRGTKEALTGPDPADGRDEPYSMLAFAVALNAAQPWLDEAAPAPPWFGSGGPTSSQAPDLDVAYHGFMSAPEWDLAGRSEGAAEAAARPRAGAEAEQFQLETLHTEPSEPTALRETAAEHRPIASQEEAPEPEQALYQEGNVLLTRRNLALPNRTIDLLAISSIWVDRQSVETGKSNWFLKVPGFFIQVGGFLVLMSASFYMLWNIIFHVLNWIGIETESCSRWGDCHPFQAYTMIQWGIRGAIIVIGLLVFLLGDWLGDKSARKQRMYCAAVSVEGENVAAYFGHSAERASAERMVAEINMAHPAIRLEEPKIGREFWGFWRWAAGLLGVGVLVFVVLVGFRLVSPDAEPCPVNSPRIPAPGPLSFAGDLILDECVSVTGEVVWRDIEELVVEIDRGEYVQHVSIRGAADVFEGISVRESVDVAGRVEEHEDGGHVVHHGVDRGWWGNLRENLPGGVLTR